jgi:hypothetical protein
MSIESENRTNKELIEAKAAEQDEGASVVREEPELEKQERRQTPCKRTVAVTFRSLAAGERRRLRIGAASIRSRRNSVLEKAKPGQFCVVHLSRVGINTPARFIVAGTPICSGCFNDRPLTRRYARPGCLAQFAPVNGRIHCSTKCTWIECARRRRQKTRAQRAPRQCARCGRNFPRFGRRVYCSSRCFRIHRLQVRRERHQNAERSHLVSR